MFSRILDALFGCGHRRYTFPMTIKKARRSPAAGITGTYVVCLDCGKEFTYDWKQMRIVNPHGERVAVTSLATKEAS